VAEVSVTKEEILRQDIERATAQIEVWKQQREAIELEAKQRLEQLDKAIREVTADIEKRREALEG
jgi:hypothetical protein